MMNKAVGTFHSIATFLVILMWVYAAASKLLAFQEFRHSMYNQPLNASLRLVLIYTLPLFEIFTALLIVFRRTEFAGLIISFILMISFTLYIVLGLMHALKWVPCSCGGILQQITWQTHLIFNSFYLTLILITLFLTPKHKLSRDHRNHKPQAF